MSNILKLEKLDNKDMYLDQFVLRSSMVSFIFRLSQKSQKSQLKN